MTTQQIVDLFNELHGLDPDFLLPLIETRLPCNQAIADHPTVVVDGDDVGGPWRVGLLGILEGIAGIDGQLIGMLVDENTKKLTGFKIIGLAEAGRELATHVPAESELQGAQS